MQNDKKLTFTELAILAMEMVNRPITPSELWEFVLQNQLHHRLTMFNEQTQTLSGKTPHATFSRNIYTDTFNFAEVPNTKPKQYVLKNKNADFRQPETPKTTPKKSFHERDLHPILAYFLHESDYFQAYAKTIFHEESTKNQKGADKWLYPDMVAAHFEYANYQKSNVLNFIKKFDILPIKLFSFEIKKELDFGNFKEAFFQAVSNSSWANEGYLVACEIKQDNQFIESLQKLSQSFGIGIIHLNLNDIASSSILSPAQFKDKMDYSVVNELANKNPNFSQFLKTVTDFEPQNPDRFTREFDAICDQNQLDKYIKNLI